MHGQGFLWGINSFDQWGVELGKVLAAKVRTAMHNCRTKSRKVASVDGFNPSTTRLLNKSAPLLWPCISATCVWLCPALQGHALAACWWSEGTHQDVRRACGKKHCPFVLFRQ